MTTHPPTFCTHLSLSLDKLKQSNSLLPWGCFYRRATAPPPSPRYSPQGCTPVTDDSPRQKAGL